MLLSSSLLRPMVHIRCIIDHRAPSIGRIVARFLLFRRGGFAVYVLFFAQLLDLLKLFLLALHSLPDLAQPLLERLCPYCNLRYRHFDLFRVVNDAELICDVLVFFWEDYLIHLLLEPPVVLLLTLPVQVVALEIVDGHLHPRFDLLEIQETDQFIVLFGVIFVQILHLWPAALAPESRPRAVAHFIQIEPDVYCEDSGDGP